jgi:hypothetical protein
VLDPSKAVFGLQHQPAQAATMRYESAPIATDVTGSGELLRQQRFAEARLPSNHGGLTFGE